MTDQPDQLPAEEDKKTWNELTNNIKKLKKTDTEASLLASNKHNLKFPFREGVDGEARRGSSSSLSTKNSSAISGESTQNLQNNTANIDRNTLKKFHNYEFPIDAELDLHGHTEEQAYNAVFKFIKASYSQGKRCIIIITGKGLHKSEDDYIFTKRTLKDQAPNWLNSPELTPYILTFTHPKPSLGGTGALYILLKRNKNTPTDKRPL